MSDDNQNQTPKPNPLKTQPLKKTSAVPLRKETVRVTLKAPGAGAPAPAPPAAPSAPAPAPTIPLGGGVPTAPPTKSMTPDTDKVQAKAPGNVELPDVTSAVPLKQETMRVTLKAGEEDGAPAAPAPAPSAPVPAPTIPLGSGTPKPAAPAPTVQLNTGSAPTGPTTVPLATQPLGAGGASQQLPKATVQLQQTQQLTTPIGGASQVATIQTANDDDIETKEGQGLMIGLSVTAFIASAVLFYFSWDHATVWIDEHKKGDMMKILD